MKGKTNDFTRNACRNTVKREQGIPTVNVHLLQVCSKCSILAALHVISTYVAIAICEFASFTQYIQLQQNASCWTKFSVFKIDLFTVSAHIEGRRSIKIYEGFKVEEYSNFVHMF